MLLLLHIQALLTIAVWLFFKLQHPILQHQGIIYFMIWRHDLLVALLHLRWPELWQLQGPLLKDLKYLISHICTSHTSCQGAAHTAASKYQLLHSLSL